VYAYRANPEIVRHRQEKWFGAPHPEENLMPPAVDPSSILDHAIADHLSVVRSLEKERSLLERIAEEMTQAVLAGKKVLCCGNGGSAADSQHLAAEWTHRFRRERCGLASIAPTTDTSILTAVANDYGYEKVFQRQAEARGRRAGRHLNFRFKQKRVRCLRQREACRRLHGCIYGRGRRDSGLARRYHSLDCLERYRAHPGSAHPLRAHDLRRDRKVRLRTAAGSGIEFDISCIVEVKRECA
jgi:hypothetical protein